MRVGELKHLTWDDVDLDQGVVYIRPKRGWKPKTGNIRVIPISPKVRAVFEGLPRKAEWVFTSRPSRKYPRGDAQISERRLLQYIKRVLSRLGLPGHVHTFRHAFISAALSSGVPEAVVRDWVGHVDDRIIRLYTHIADETSKAAMNKLASAMDDKAIAPDEKAGTVDDKANADGTVQPDASVNPETDGDSAQFQHNGEEADDGDSAK
jgi:integrase